MFALLRFVLGRPWSYGTAAMALACCWCLPAGASSLWDPLGPGGGEISSVAAGPVNSGKVYALVTNNKTRTYSSDDGGLHWTEQAGPTNCSWPYSSKLQVRADGNVFLDCSGPILRSGDGTRSWTPFTPATLDGQLAFDPARATGAAVRNRGAGFTSNDVAYTADDGLNWLLPPTQDAPIPGLIAFDVLRPGRMIGVGTELPSVNFSTQYLTRFYESFDHGAHWTGISAVLPQHGDVPNCYYEREFSIDTAGRLFINHDCGLFRSVDAGATWQLVTGFPGDRFSPIAVDPANPGRLLVQSSQAVSESRDAGISWQALPAPPASFTRDFDVSGAGELWIATSDGVYLYDPSGGTWLARNTGLNAHPIVTVEPGIGNGLVLSAIDRSYFGTGNVQSFDGGRTWAPFSMGGKPVAQLARNISVPSSILALTWEDNHELYSSNDGGVTWQLVSSNPSPAADQLVTGLVAVGLQPGIVYGLYETCIFNGFDGCFWTPQGVTKSVDGGATWSNMNNGIAQPVFRIVVSPVDPNTAFASGTDGLYITRDGAAHWQQAASTVSTRLVADPTDAARWYAIGPPGVIATTSDYGVHWSPLSDANIVSAAFDLLIDPRDPLRLFAVGTSGEVSVSSDRGASWQRIVEPITTLSLSLGSTRLSPGLPTTIYAAGLQGVFQLTVVSSDLGAPAIPTLHPLMTIVLTLGLMCTAFLARASIRVRSRGRA